MSICQILMPRWRLPSWLGDLNAMREAGSAQGLLDGILEAVQSFTESRGFEDDIAMIAIRREAE